MDACERTRLPISKNNDEQVGPNRCSSPIARRKRSSRSSSTPFHDTAAAELLSASRKLPDSLWPSTMRSLTVSHQPENSKPLDSLHRKPTTTTAKVSPTTPSLRRLFLGGNTIGRKSLDRTTKPSNKSTNDLPTLVSRDVSERASSDGRSVDDSSLRHDSSSDKTQLASSAARPLTIPTLGLLPILSPMSKASRLPSPARVRPSSPIRKLESSRSTLSSILSFITDIRLLKKPPSHTEDAHHLWLLYNRLLQWRYANAQAQASSQSQKLKAEKMLCSVWMSVAALWDSVSEKRIEIELLRLKLKLYSILDDQIFCLEEWDLTETDHVSSLNWAIQDLQANTVRVPVVRGARGDIESIKAAVWSAVDVMQAMGSSLCSIVSKVERGKWLVSELADVVIQSRAMFDEYESILNYIAALQVEENSLTSQLLQM